MQDNTEHVYHANITSKFELGDAPKYTFKSPTGEIICYDKKESRPCFRGAG